MAALTEIRSFSSKSCENRESEEDEIYTGTLFDVFQGKMAECVRDNRFPGYTHPSTQLSRLRTSLLKMNTEREKDRTSTGENEDVTENTLYQQHVAQTKDEENIVLQQLIIISRLLCQPADRAELGVHFEKVHFHLSKEFELDHMTGLLLIYPSCVLHIVESSREVLLCVLKDLKKLQQHPNHARLEESKVVFLRHNPHGRLFQQWSYKVISAGQKVQGLEEEENTKSLVCMVLSALQELETSKHVPESWEFIIPQDLVLKLLGQDDLLSPEEHLQLYDSPLNIIMDFGQAVRSQFINRV